MTSGVYQGYLDSTRPGSDCLQGNGSHTFHGREIYHVQDIEHRLSLVLIDILQIDRLVCVNS